MFIICSNKADSVVDVASQELPKDDWFSKLPVSVLMFFPCHTQSCLCSVFVSQKMSLKAINNFPLFAFVDERYFQ